jgi:hypothetical protein
MIGALEGPGFTTERCSDGSRPGLTTPLGPAPAETLGENA